MLAFVIGAICAYVWRSLVAASELDPRWGEAPVIDPGTCRNEGRFGGRWSKPQLDREGRYGGRDRCSQ